MTPFLEDGKIGEGKQMRSSSATETPAVSSCRRESLSLRGLLANSCQIFPVCDLRQKLEDDDLLFYEVSQVRFSALSLQSCLREAVVTANSRR